MPRTIEITAYQFSELSEAAKEAAHNEHLSKGYPNDWSRENLGSWKKFLDIFPVKSYGNSWSNIAFTDEESIENLSGQRLATYIWNNYKKDLFKGKYYSTGGRYDEAGKYHHKFRYSKIQLQGQNCVMTGYCMDDSILDPIYKFLAKPDKNTDFMGLMNECANAWSKAMDDDDEWQNSIEHFAEECEANEYEFDEHGKRI